LTNKNKIQHKMAVLDPNEIMFTAYEPKVANRFIMYIDGIPAYLN